MTYSNQYQPITFTTIQELLQSKAAELSELKKLYDLVPPTRCNGKAHCCSMLPESTLLEALAVFERLNRETSGRRHELLKKIVRYFFINPARITACPFLEDNRCTIYADRFFGCRAYGLWSPRQYDKMAGQHRQAKLSLSGQWQKLGIRLPADVIDFTVDYCTDAAVAEGPAIDDDRLVRISTDIHQLSGRLEPWHQTFSGMYYADFSFLTAANIFEIPRLLRLKVNIVRGCVETGSSDILEKTLENLKIP